MEFNSESMDNIIDNMRKVRNKINTSLTNLQEIQKKLDSCWISGIEEDYKVKYKDALSKISAYDSELKKCIIYLKKIKDKYEVLEKTNTVYFD